MVTSQQSFLVVTNAVMTIKNRWVAIILSVGNYNKTLTVYWCCEKLCLPITCFELAEIKWKS